MIEPTWLENRSFSIESSTIPFQQQSSISTKSKPIIDKKLKQEKKPIAKPVQNIPTKKNEASEFVFDFFDQNLHIDILQLKKKKSKRLVFKQLFFSRVSRKQKERKHVSIMISPLKKNRVSTFYPYLISHQRSY